VANAVLREVANDDLDFQHGAVVSGAARDSLPRKGLAERASLIRRSAAQRAGTNGAGRLAVFVTRLRESGLRATDPTRTEIGLDPTARAPAVVTVDVSVDSAGQARARPHLHTNVPVAPGLAFPKAAMRQAAGRRTASAGNPVSLAITEVTARASGEAAAAILRSHSTGHPTTMQAGEVVVGTSLTTIGAGTADSPTTHHITAGGATRPKVIDRARPDTTAIVGHTMLILGAIMDTLTPIMHTATPTINTATPITNTATPITNTVTPITTRRTAVGVPTGTDRTTGDRTLKEGPLPTDAPLPTVDRSAAMPRENISMRKLRVGLSHMLRPAARRSHAIAASKDGSID
jgi:hypothetical protein